MTSRGHAHRGAGRPSLTLRYERRLWRSGFQHVAGIDEAGRGPLAGPVVAAAVVFLHNDFISGVDDSKKLASTKRTELFQQILDTAVAVGIGIVDNTVIDDINILNATFRAMHQAVGHLPVKPDHLLIDGNRFAGMGIPFTTIVDGDERSFCVAAASIVAKVTRDRLMAHYDLEYPGYGFAKHKGYATPEHREAIFRLGLSPLHRCSFTMKRQLELNL